ncbi:fibrinogen like 1B [Syngnathus typhle]|uniref:fibrinogen like 1B n=1 Tax=Syngnathus typhle TaxID=161592 RepID=UPI002A6AFE32|nr:fibrinogen like 1B [Syngnathus typhle]
MKTSFPMLMFFLVFPTKTSSSGCSPDVAALKRSIKRLENKLVIRTWQVENLQRDQFFRQISPAPTPPSDSNTTLTTPLPAAGSLMVHDRDCSELFDRIRPSSGFYRIRPKIDQEPLLVYCDMDDGGGWTVFQRRRNGKVDFDRDWVDYRDGFGDFKLWNDEFWLGNEHIYSLLSDGRNLVKIDLMDWAGQRSHAYYENFRISNEADRYRLRYKTYSGKAGDALAGGGGMVERWSAGLSSMQFSTRDQDNDRYTQGSCAQENNAGWWYNRCHFANLNGKFYRKGEYKGQFDNGIVWGTWRGLWYSLRHTAMKVRPLLFLDAMGSGGGEG